MADNYLPKQAFDSPLVVFLITAVQFVFWLPVRLIVVVMRRGLNRQLTTSSIIPTQHYTIVANHQSMLDPFMICGSLSLPVYLKLMPYRFFVHNGFIDNPWLRPFLILLGGFPAREHERYWHGIAAAERYLAGGQTSVIFPEGKRTPARIPAKPGAGVLAQIPSNYLIPAHIHWHKGRYPWQLKFRLAIGDPINASDLSSDEIMDKIYSLELKK